MLSTHIGILTFDISSKACGFAFGAEGSLISYGKYVADKDESIGQGLLKFSKWCSKTIHSLPYRPKVVLIEAPYFNRNANTFSILSKFVGIAQREVFRTLDIDADLVPSSAVKKSLNVVPGRTHADRKFNMVKRINQLLGLSLEFHKSNKYKSDDDIADAIAILVYYFTLHETDA